MTPGVTSALRPGPGRPAPLISATELSLALASAAPPIVLDVRWSVGTPSQHKAYLTGHIPSAQWCDLDADLADPPGPSGRHPLPDPARLQLRLRELGINDESEIVAYDGGTSFGAARAWWVLRWAGLGSVQVLDGGLRAWSESDQAIETEVRVRPAGRFDIRPGSLPSLSAAGAGDLAAHGRLLDARAPERFRGEVEPMDPVAGHIPGALNLPTTELAGSDGGLKAAAAVRRSVVSAGVDPDGPIGVYCGSGVTASHTLLALAAAGIEATLYPGSWSEWITDPQRPVALG